MVWPVTPRPTRPACQHHAHARSRKQQSGGHPDDPSPDHCHVRANVPGERGEGGRRGSRGDPDRRPGPGHVAVAARAGRAAAEARGPCPWPRASPPSSRSPTEWRRKAPNAIGSIRSAQPRIGQQGHTLHSATVLGRRSPRSSRGEEKWTLGVVPPARSRAQARGLRAPGSRPGRGTRGGRTSKTSRRLPRRLMSRASRSPKTRSSFSSTRGGPRPLGEQLQRGEEAVGAGRHATGRPADMQDHHRLVVEDHRV